MTHLNTVHQFNPNPLPDNLYTPGSLQFLVVGNKSWLLDRRRTPGVIEATNFDEGMFRWRIADFEDLGKYWDIPLEWVTKMQFENGSTSLSPSKISELNSIIQTLDKPLFIPVDEALRAQSLAKIRAMVPEIKIWLKSNSSSFQRCDQFDYTQTSSSPELANDLIQFMRSIGLEKQEELTSETYVLNPFSGEWLKGIEIAIANLGLKEFNGTAPRTKGIFEEAGAMELRQKYIIARMAFLQAMFSLLGHQEVALFRGMCTEGPWVANKGRFFSSWSFSKNVAKTFVSFDADAKQSYLMKRTFAVEKLFMTHLETKAMNNQYKEVEAVVMHDSTDERLW